MRQVDGNDQYRDGKWTMGDMRIQDSSDHLGIIRAMIRRQGKKGISSDGVYKARTYPAMNKDGADQGNEMR